MAEKMGLDRSFMADVERGKRNISILNLDIIAKGFGISLAQLVSRLWLLFCQIYCFLKLSHYGGNTPHFNADGVWDR